MNKLAWFRHDNTAGEDTWHQEMMDKLGMAGYGRWWRLTELFDRHRKGEWWSTTMAQLRRDLRCRGGEVEKIFIFSSSSSRLLWTKDGEKIKICLPKFLKLQDNLRRKTGTKSDQLAYTIRETAESPSSLRSEGLSCAAQPRHGSTGRQERIKDSEPYKPKTAHQRLMCAYKIAIGVPWDSRGWDKARYGRFAPACQRLLDAFKGDDRKAAQWLMRFKERMVKARLAWTLDTAAGKAWDEESERTQEG